jgi:uncharacterized protein (DUF952 family)
MTEQIVYKVCPRSAWTEALAAGRYTGSADDLRDGYIHFSSKAQLAGTLAKYFRGQPNLVLVAIATDPLGGALRWEPSRGGDLFPHLYTALPVSAALTVHHLALGPDGIPQLPEEIA